MRYSIIIVVAALTGLATSALAQDRTPPTGAIDVLRAGAAWQDRGEVGDPAYFGEFDQPTNGQGAHRYHNR